MLKLDRSDGHMTLYYFPEVENIHKSQVKIATVALSCSKDNDVTTECNNMTLMFNAVNYSYNSDVGYTQWYNDENQIGF